MATVQKRGESSRIIFSYQRQQHSITIGKVASTEAVQWASRVDHLLMRLKQGMLELPDGVSIQQFMLADGKAVAKPKATTTFGELRDAYVEVRSNGSLEENTLYTTKLNLRHIEETLGENFRLAGLALKNLQTHVDRRLKDRVKAQVDKKKKLSKEEQKKFSVRTICPVTIQKEITTFKTCWDWGLTAGLVQQAFPSKGLSYPKLDEKPPFATMEEIQPRIDAGADSNLWESLYLDATHIAELLAYVKGLRRRPWVYPMLVACAHTGMRRSELLRLMVHDVDLKARRIIIREKKRVKGRRSTRQVPMSDLLAIALEPLLVPGRIYLFGDGQKPLTPNYAKLTFKRVVKGSKWSVVRGWHVLRHSFISACAITLPCAANDPLIRSA